MKTRLRDGGVSGRGLGLSPQKIDREGIIPHHPASHEWLHLCHTIAGRADGRIVCPGDQTEEDIRTPNATPARSAATVGGGPFDETSGGHFTGDPTDDSLP